jgi:hypothetical protein
MKRSKRHYRFRYEEKTERQIIRRDRMERKGGFTCSHCRQWVVINDLMGTANRNHCNLCLWSKHVDEKKGDRLSLCQARMRPIGLTFRIEGALRRREIMLIHDCAGCGKLSINRIAADDTSDNILSIFEASLKLGVDLWYRIQHGGILRAMEADREEILTQLFGRA